MQFPAIPLPMPTRYAPRRFRINRGVANLTLFPVFFMSSPSRCLQQRALKADGPPLLDLGVSVTPPLSESETSSA
jgi:hypothetical protein